MNTYDRGQMVRLSAAITDLTQQPVDPTLVVWRVVAPRGRIQQYSYPAVGTAVVRDDVGTYHLDLQPPLDPEGEWAYRVDCTAGALRTGAEGRFLVEESAF